MRRFARLPGIGPRSAERIVFYLLKAPADDVLDFASSMRDLKTKIRHCPITFNLTEGDRCPIYDDPARDRRSVLVVEQPKDVIAIENAGSFKGTYHVLLGRIAPLEGIEPEDLTVGPLLQRLADDEVTEVILGLNPNVEGDATAMYLQDLIRRRRPGIKLTRLARGLPAGGSIEFANRSMLSDALSGRREVED